MSSNLFNPTLLSPRSWTTYSSGVRDINGTFYTNSTGKPLFVQVMASVNNPAGILTLILVNTTRTLCRQTVYPVIGLAVATVQGWILPGETYAVTGTGLTLGALGWIEWQ